MRNVDLASYNHGHLTGRFIENSHAQREKLANTYYPSDEYRRECFLQGLAVGAAQASCGKLAPQGLGESARALHRRLAETSVAELDPDERYQLLELYIQIQRMLVAVM